MAAIRRQLAKDRVLALTYDDGPSSTLTPQLLDLLHQRAVHATFFMLGRNAKLHSGIADRVAQEGHEIGCHSYAHLNAWKTLPARVVADIDAGYEGLSAWIQPDAPFRPPYGKMTLPTFWSIRHRRAPVWWWTIDSRDTNLEIPRPSEIADRLSTDGGGIVLMHDLHEWNCQQRRVDFVLEVTNSLLDVARQKSLRVLTLKELSR